MRTSSYPIEEDGLHLGEVMETSAEAQEAVANGWRKCEAPRCHFYASPQGIDWLTERQYSEYDCPHCGQNQDLLERIDKEQDNEHVARAGMSLSQFGKMGEAAINEVVSKSPEWQAKYGEIIWWQPGVESLSSGGAAEHGRLDGLSRDANGTVYGIEVKSANVDNANPEFIVNNADRAKKHDYAANYATHEPELSQQLGIQPRMNVPEVPAEHENVAARRTAEAEAYTQGNNDIDALLAVLPVFDFNNSMVDIYVKETPLSGWQGSGGSRANTTYYGFGKFRAQPKSDPEQYALLKQIPFENPFMNPHENSYPIVKPSQMFDFRAPTKDELFFSDDPQFGSADEIWEDPNSEMPF